MQPAVLARLQDGREGAGLALAGRPSLAAGLAASYDATRLAIEIEIPPALRPVLVQDLVRPSGRLRTGGAAPR